MACKSGPTPERRLPGSLCELAGLRRASRPTLAASGWLTARPVAGAGGRGADGPGFRDRFQAKRSVLQLPRHRPPALFAGVHPPLRSASTFLKATATPRPSRQQRSLVYQRAKGDPTSGPSAPRRMCSTGLRVDQPLAGAQPHRIAGLPASPLAPTEPSPFGQRLQHLGDELRALSANAILALNAGARRSLRA